MGGATPLAYLSVVEVDHRDMAIARLDLAVIVLAGSLVILAVWGWLRR